MRFGRVCLVLVFSFVFLLAAGAGTAAADTFDYRVNSVWPDAVMDSSETEVEINEILSYGDEIELYVEVATERYRGETDYSITPSWDSAQWERYNSSLRRYVPYRPSKDGGEVDFDWDWLRFDDRGDEDSTWVTITVPDRAGSYRVTLKLEGDSDNDLYAGSGVTVLFDVKKSTQSVVPRGFDKVQWLPPLTSARSINPNATVPIQFRLSGDREYRGDDYRNRVAVTIRDSARRAVTLNAYWAGNKWKVNFKPRDYGLTGICRISVVGADKAAQFVVDSGPNAKVKLKKPASAASAKK